MIGLLFIAGVALILPLLGLSYWIAVAVCLVSIYCIIALASGQSAQKGKSKQRNLARVAIMRPECGKISVSPSGYGIR
jgi:hypothetical protein